MNSREYIKKYINSYLLIIIFAYILSINLVYPKFSMLSIAIQTIAINLWVYLIHVLSHKLPNSVLNYHIYSHHNKNLQLPRWLELIGEFFCDMSWFFLLAGIKYIFNISYLSYTLIFFVGLWYSSVHVINLSLIKSSEHITHHEEKNYNFGPPYHDMIFGTLKSDNNEIEIYQINNGIVIFLLFNMLSNYFHFTLQV